MAALILPSRRVVQPQGPVEIDRGNPLTAGIQFAYIPAFSRFSSVNNAGFQGGSAVFGAATTGQGIAYPTPPVFLGSLSQSTILAVGSTRAVTGGGVGQIGSGGDAIFSERGSSGSDIYKIGLVAVDTLSAEFVYRNDAGNLLQQRVQCVGLNDGRKIAISATKNGTTHRVGINRVFSSGTIGNASTAFTNATLTRQIGADLADTAAAWNGYVDVVAGWDRALSVAEINALTDNPWQLFRPIQRRIWVPVAGGGTIITASQSGSWSVRNNVSALQAGSWSVRNQAATTQAGAWSVRTSVATTQAAAWSVRNYASASQSGAFSVRNYSAATQASAWSIRNLASALQAGAWSVENAAGTASALQSGSWSVRNLAAATQPASWSVRNTAATTAPGAWSVRSAVQAAQAGAWKVSVYAAALQGASWTVRNYAGATQAGAWSLDEAGRVTASQPGSWSVRNLVATSQPGSWSVRQLAAAAQAAVWSVRNFTTTSQTGAWSVRGYASAVQAGAWSVITRPTAFQSGAWSVGFDISTGPAFYVSTVPSKQYLSKVNSTLYVSKAD